MKYLKRFDTQTNYNDWKNSEAYIEPNICIINNVIDFKAKAFTKYVDLGLPSGTLWASCNFGADKPYKKGLYICWAECNSYTEEQCINNYRKFSKENYIYNDTGGKLHYSKYNSSDHKTLLDNADDIVFMLGNKTSMGEMCTPTKEQCDELINPEYTKCIPDNIFYGYHIISKINKNSIFLPAQGFYYLKETIINDPRLGQIKRYNNALCGGCYYWTSNLNNDKTGPEPFYLHININDEFPDTGLVFRRYRYYAFPIRPIKRINS